MAKSSKSTRRFPLFSSFLLLVAYFSFGWFLSDPAFPTIASVTQRLFGFYIPILGEISIFLIFAVIWTLVICSAFINPLVSFSRFINHWFKSDTVAFLSIFMVASLATFILFWLHIFLYILLILATEALARVDVQTVGYNNSQAFLILLFVSLIGLSLGCIAREYAPFVFAYLSHFFFNTPVEQLSVEQHHSN